MSDNSLEVVETTQEQANPVEAENKETVENAEESTEAVEAKEDESVKEEDTKELSDADKMRHAMQKRIDRMTAAKKADEERLRAEIDELKKQVESVKPDSKDAEPKMEDYESFEEFETAKAKFLADKMFNERLEQENQRKQQELLARENEVRKRAFAEKENAFKSQTPDYDVAAESFRALSEDLQAIKGKDNQTLQAIGQAIIESDFAPHIIYEIGNNPDIAQEMAEMSPIQAIKEIAKMELTANKPKSTEKPPKPVDKVGGSTKSTSTPNAIADRMLKGMGYNV